MSVCGREKCAFKRKPYPPGVHGRAHRRASSEYGSQLKEKQKIKFLYGLRERQFKNYVLSAVFQKGMPIGEAVVSFLETRLDNVVYRLGFAPTRAASRQLVNHGHILVNGKRANIPSLRLRIGDEISIASGSAQKTPFANLNMILKKFSPPEWIELDKTVLKAKVTAHPPVSDLMKNYNINAIVEYYSR